MFYCLSDQQSVVNIVWVKHRSLLLCVILKDSPLLGNRPLDGLMSCPLLSEYSSVDLEVKLLKLCCEVVVQSIGPGTVRG